MQNNSSNKQPIIYSTMMVLLVFLLVLGSVLISGCVSLNESDFNTQTEADIPSETEALESTTTVPETTETVTIEPTHNSYETFTFGFLTFEKPYIEPYSMTDSEGFILLDTENKATDGTPRIVGAIHKDYIGVYSYSSQYDIQQILQGAEPVDCSDVYYVYYGDSYIKKTFEEREDKNNTSESKLFSKNAYSIFQKGSTSPSRCIIYLSPDIDEERYTYIADLINSQVQGTVFPDYQTFIANQPRADITETIEGTEEITEENDL